MREKRWIKNTPDKPFWKNQERVEVKFHKPTQVYSFGGAKSRLVMFHVFNCPIFAKRYDEDVSEWRLAK